MDFCPQHGLLHIADHLSKPRPEAQLDPLVEAISDDSLWNCVAEAGIAIGFGKPVHLASNFSAHVTERNQSGSSGFAGAIGRQVALAESSRNEKLRSE